MTDGTMPGRDRFLAAANLQEVDRTPVWYMRQAGRCLPEYRALRANHSFMEMATTPELAVQATLMPVDRFGVDGAVLFADIMLPLAGMGIDFEIKPGVGPVIANPIRTMADIERIRVVSGEEGTPHVMSAMRLLRSELGHRAAALGFAGAPWTMACYLIEGKPSREYPHAKAMMYGEPELWQALMTKITDATIAYVEGQIEAGADVVQLFDSWLGLVDEASYRAWVQPHSARILAAIRKRVPAIHFSTATAHLLSAIAGAEPSMISLDWRVPMNVAPHVLGPEIGIQGNLDPSMLFAPWEVVQAQAEKILAAAPERGHIFNLGHGIHPETNPDQLTRLTEFVHSSRNGHV